MSIFYLITTVGKRGEKTVQAMALVAFACSSGENESAICCRVDFEKKDVSQ